MFWFLSLLLQLLAIALIFFWVFTNPRGFLSVCWRTLMGLVLVGSILDLIAFVASPMAEYQTQFIIGASAGLVLSISALVRSFLKKNSL